jgi:hypothetical protein
MFRNIKLPPEFKALEDMLQGKVLMSGMAIAGLVVAAVGLTFGAVQGLSGATKAQRAKDKARDEAAKAIARARQAVTKNVALERQIPMIGMDNLLKEQARQQKQLIEGLRGSGQRAVTGGIPVIGEASAAAMEKMRGEAEKQLLEREDKIAEQQIVQDQQQLNLIAAEGSGARMQEARAAQQKQLHLASAGKSVSKGLQSILGNEDIIGLYGKTSDKRIERVLGKVTAGNPDVVMEEGDNVGLFNYAKTLPEYKDMPDAELLTTLSEIDYTLDPTLLQGYEKYKAPVIIDGTQPGE